MIVPVALAMMLERCAPNVGPVTMSAVVQYESGWHPTAIDDNTTHRAYYPSTKTAAVRLASNLIANGHVIDMGLAQVDSENLVPYRVSVSDIFDPCVNLSVGSQILSHAYARAVNRYGPGQLALWHALQAYNSGNLNGRPSYANGVFREAFSGDNVSMRIPPVSTSFTDASSQIVVENAMRANVLVWRKAIRASKSRSLPLTGANVYWNSSNEHFRLAVPVSVPREKRQKSTWRPMR